MIHFSSYFGCLIISFPPKTLLVKLPTLTPENNEEQEDSDDDEEDPEELAQFFPNFLWVLRDFSLELVDQNGKQITPKEYLENALALHKGISDTVQEKNRLRRLICQFFPERNCFPLVRPVLEEGKYLYMLDLKGEIVVTD